MVKVTSSGELLGSGEPLASDPARIVDVADPSGIVLEAGFLFSAEFTRLGDDLLLHGADGAQVLLRNYFGQVAPPPLETADGAGLAPETVEALAGPAIPRWFAQAGDTPFGAPVGEVSSLNGIARVQRSDGTRSDLDEGDPIFQGDVVSTGVGSDLGILFADDTVFSLSANARVVVNEFVYNPAGTGNAMGVSLIQGTFVFVTGEIAPSGEMDVATPVGTIGIRGTTVGVRIATFSGATRIVNIENPETREIGSFTFSNFGGSTRFTQANDFLEIRSADVIPGRPALISSQALSDIFGRSLNSATEIQRSIEREQSGERQSLPQEAARQDEAPQEQPLFQPPIETGANGDQPLGEGSSFAAGFAGAGLDAGLVASDLLATGTLDGVETSGFGLLALDDRFTFILDRPIEDPEPPINVVYLIDVSGSMNGASDGTAPSPSSPSRLELATQTLLALNQQFIDGGLADRVTIKVIAFRADTDLSVIEANSAELDGADVSGLEALVAGLLASGGTQYEGPLRVAADWLREDLDPGAVITERHDDSINVIYLFSDGDEDYRPDASLVADLYDNGSGAPNISNLTVHAFGFGVPGVADFSADQLGKVETGSLGHGDEVTVISDTGDIAEIFSTTTTATSTAQPAVASPLSGGAEATEALRLADLVDEGDPALASLQIESDLATESSAGSGSTEGGEAATFWSASTSPAVVAVSDLNPEALASLA